MSVPTRTRSFRRMGGERKTEPPVTVCIEGGSKKTRLPLKTSLSSKDLHHPSTSSDDSSNDDDLVSILQGLAIGSSPASAIDYYGGDIPTGASMSIKTIDISEAKFAIQFTLKDRSQPVIEMPIRSTLRKTAAVLRRGSNDPLIVAVSGWSNIFPMDHDYVLDKVLMKARVFKMCAVIGHKLPKAGQLDGGTGGAYYACHAEKQLLASLFFDEKEMDEAKIYVSRKPCEDCKSCIRRFAETMGVEVKLRFRK